MTRLVQNALTRTTKFNSQNTLSLNLGTVVERYETGEINVSVDGMGSLIFFENSVVGLPNKLRLPNKGDRVLVGFVRDNFSQPVLIGVLKNGYIDALNINDLADEIKNYPESGINVRVSGEDGKITVERDDPKSGSEASIEIEFGNDLKITVASSKKIQLHAENVELGGEAAQELVNKAAVAIFNAHFHVETGTNTSTPKAMVEGAPVDSKLKTGIHTTKKVKAE